ncbi:MAG: Rieske (2Fe-2S) protein, partial [Verrucomicrobia bacterium]|nr:Rieske (2Fe-2S) protein [Verrucomicrobiota bacterium]
MSRSQPLCPAADLPPGTTRKFIFTYEGIRREGFAANVRGHLVAYENACRHI